MKRVKMFATWFLVSIFAVTAIATVVYATTYGEESAESILDPKPSAFAQQIPKQVAEIQGDLSMDEISKIKGIITLLFEAKRDQNEHPTLGDFDFSVFWGTSSTHAENLSYFERSVKAEKETFAGFNQFAGNSNTELTFQNVSVNGDTAEVVVYEWFEYQYCSAADGALVWPSTTGSTSGTGVTYVVSLRQVEGAWLIEDISYFNEATDRLKDNNVDVDTFVLERYESAVTVKSSELSAGMTDEELAEPEGAVLPPDLPIITRLDVDKFYEYAEQYAGSARNPLFPNFSADCQNYASQCLWYGLGGSSTQTAISNAYEPMIGPDVTSNAERQWYMKGTSAYSRSWAGTISFGNHVADSNATGVGLHGAIYEGVANAQVGDIIQIGETDDEGEVSYFHSYVVVGANGTYGSRTAKDITVCAHTTNRTDTLLSAIYNNTYEYRTIHITGVMHPQTTTGGGI